MPTLYQYRLNYTTASDTVGGTMLLEIWLFCQLTQSAAACCQTLSGSERREANNL